MGLYDHEFLGDNSDQYFIGQPRLTREDQIRIQEPRLKNGVVMRSGIAVVALAVCLGLMGCSKNKSNKEATMLPPPPPLESEPLPSSLSTPPADIAPAPAPAASTYTPAEPIQWEPAPKAAKPASNGQNYVVQKGDTLYGIARRFYGSGNNWKTIAELNGITDPKQLRVGQEIILP